MFFRMVYKSGQIFLPFCHNPRVWQTDRRTDGQTDKRTEISSQYRGCSWEFNQMYNFGAIGDKDELVRFWGQKIKGQARSSSDDQENLL